MSEVIEGINDNEPIILNEELSPKDDRDFIAEAFFPEAESLPEELFYPGFPVRSQGSIGSCSAMTASAIKDVQEIKDSNITEPTSPLFVYNLRANKTSGMTPRDTMKILNQIGIVPESMFPYDTKNSKQPDDSIKSAATKYRINAYAKVHTILGLKKALWHSGPCYLSVPVYNYSKRMWKKNEGDKLIGGHAMAIVGYNPDGFIIKNSWGTNWGANGYTIFPYDDWGMQNEVWTIIDADSNTVKPYKMTALEWFRKNWIALVVGLAGIILVLSLVIVAIKN